MAPRGESVVLEHPPLVGDSLGWYAKGCRCVQCRAANAAAALRGRKRKAMGLTSPYQTVPAGPVVEVLAGMRDAGMVWDGMASLVGVDRRDLQRLLRRGPEGRVTRRMEAMVFAAAASLGERPGLVHRNRQLFREGDRLRWMINCLQARGWTGEWIGGQVGWTHPLSTSVVSHDVVSADLWARVEGVFKAYQGEWGPSRLGAVRAWRSGKFPADCYDMDLPREVRYLPVPGSLHPDLVGEAMVFRSRSGSGVGRVRSAAALLRRRWGQWERESCAAATFRSWQRALGLPVADGADDRDGDGGRDGRLVSVCGVTVHRHGELPEVWLPFDRL